MRLQGCAIGSEIREAPFQLVHRRAFGAAVAEFEKREHLLR